jgi:hypothetical protein
MKVIHVPIEVFEPGDHVLTSDGGATVVRDGLDDEKARNEIPNRLMPHCLVVKLDEPTSKHPTPGEDVLLDRMDPILIQAKDGGSPVEKKPTGHRWNGKDEAFCTSCGTSVPKLDGLERCPSCGDKGYPCLWSEQTTVSVNIHELHVLCVWAERWVNIMRDEHMQASCAKSLRAIVSRLLGQLPKETILLLCDDIKAIKDKGLDVESNFVDI